MTHLPYIAASYALGVLVPVVLGLDAAWRSRGAARRLLAVDRRRRPGRP